MKKKDKKKCCSNKKIEKKIETMENGKDYFEKSENNKNEEN